MRAPKSVSGSSPTARIRPQIVLFRLLLLSHARLTDGVRQLLGERCGLTMAQFDMITELGRHESTRIGDLGNKTLISPSSATRIAKVLEGKGLVRRQRDSYSEREVRVSLTKRGEALLKEQFEAIAEAIGALFDDKLSRTEQRDLTTLLRKLSDDDRHLAARL